MTKKIKKETSAKEISVTKSVAEKKQDVKVLTPLKDLIGAYVEARDRLKVLDEEYDKAAIPLKEAKQEVQSLIVEEFKRRGEFSTRIEGSTASLSVRKTVVIMDESRAVKALKDAGLTDYISETVNDLFKEGPAKEIAAGNSPLLDGMGIKETEYISVRTNEKKDPRKIVTGEYQKLERSVNG